MIKGCVGFSYISGHLFANMILVRGKKTIDIPLPYPVYVIMSRLWKRENFLGKILFNKSTYFENIGKRI